jgi:hypothetical protein
MSVLFFIGLMGFNAAEMLATILSIAIYVPSVRRPGIGRIIFYALLSLKFWAALVYGWFFAVTIFNAAPFLRAIRTDVYLGLTLYGSLQAAIVLIALWRWRHQNDKRDAL